MAEGLGILSSIVTHFEHSSEYCKTGFFRNGSMLFGYLNVGTENEKQSGNPVSIFPNPTSDYVFIKYETSEPITLTLADVYGNLLLNQTLHDKEKLNLSHLSQGIYFLTMVQNNKVLAAQKVIRQ